MSQLVRQHLSARARLRSILICSEDDVMSDGVRQRIDGARRLGRYRIAVHAHMAEVIAKPGLHENARSRVERIARCTEGGGYGLWQR
jgi:hypothetical protein